MRESEKGHRESARENRKSVKEILYEQAVERRIASCYKGLTIPYSPFPINGLGCH